MEMLGRYRGKLLKNHKCNYCGTKLVAGTVATCTKYKETKYYPVKGMMGFIRWSYTCDLCLGV